LTEVSKGKFY
jgi:hypothetical protein